MSNATKIEWTEATWNPVTGCDRVSPGCDHCYALTLAKRLKAMGNPRYQRDGTRKTSGPGFGVTLHHDQLDLPLRWRKPRTVFVNSMSDLFHPDVTDRFIAQVFATMAEAPHHTFQVLTKRPRRMATLLGRRDFWDFVDEEACDLLDHEGVRLLEDNPWTLRMGMERGLPNVWLGTSVENQEWADKRIPLLLETPAAVRFLSCEPLLGPINLTNVQSDEWTLDVVKGGATHLVTRGALARYERFTAERVDWVIVGGESGPQHRPLDLGWARSLRDQCVDAGVPYFFKQVGGRTPKAGGRGLDGRTWDELPAVRVLAT